MGINSTNVAYGFGQLGSVFTADATKSMFPPVGKVFVAVQCLSDGVLDVLTAAPTIDPGGNSADTFISRTGNAHANADIKDLNTTSSAGKPNKVVIDASTVESSYPGGVQVGMRFEHSVSAPRGSGVWRVESITDNNVNLDRSIAAAHAAGGASIPGFFYYDRSQGSGGSNFTKELSEGFTIFGRWTEVGLASGKFIAYIGE